MSKHNCPACGCFLGDKRLEGYDDGKIHVEGLVEKVLRLSAELRKCRERMTSRPMERFE